VHGSPGRPSLEKKGLRFDIKVLRAERQAEPPYAMLSCSGCSVRQRAFAPNPIVKFTVHLRFGCAPRCRLKVQPRRTAQKKTTSQFTSSCFGLVHGSEKWHKEHALSKHAKSESSRVGRDWPVMSVTLPLPDYGRVARHPPIVRHFTLTLSEPDVLPPPAPHIPLSDTGHDARFMRRMRVRKRESDRRLASDGFVFKKGNVLARSL
jgi:hypothetical protein